MVIEAEKSQDWSRQAELGTRRAGGAAPVEN